MDCDSDVPTARSCEQLRPSAIVFVSDSETSTEVEENSELEGSDDKTSDVCCKTDKTPSIEPFLGTTGLSIVLDNPESVVKVLSSLIADNLVQILTEQSNRYHSENAQKWKVSPQTLKWPDITPEEMRKFWY